MADYFEFRVTKDNIDEMREHTRDASLVDDYAEWIDRGDELDCLIRQIENAFTGISLGDGTGLFEAQGLDDYAAKAELADLRSRDEHVDWRLINVDTLNRCNAAPSFMNDRGFIFHLPAFLIAELNDNHEYGFIDRLFDSEPLTWMRLLTPAQRDAIAATLTLVSEHPTYRDDSDAIATTIARLEENAG